MTTKIGEHNILTPEITTLAGAKLRAFLLVSDADLAKVKRGERWRATVTDLASHQRVMLRDASCGLTNCRCAASVVRVLP